MRPVVLAVLLVVAAGSGQYWEFERVDSVPWVRPVHMRRYPDGTLFLCYQYPDSIVRVAWRDTVWHHESPAGLPDWQGPAFDIAPDGRLGVVWRDRAQNVVLLAERAGDTWSYDTTGLSVQLFGNTALGYDSVGRPWVTHSADDWFMVGVRGDSSWYIDSVDYYAGWHTSFTASRVLFDGQGRAPAAVVPGLQRGGRRVEAQRRRPGLGQRDAPERHQRGARRGHDRVTLHPPVRRQAPVVGPGDAAIRAALDGNDFRMTAGEQQRDFVFIEDVVEGVLAAAVAPGIEGRALDVGTGQLHRIRAVVERIWALSGARGQILAGALPYRPGEVPAIPADVDRTRRLTGWEAQMELGTGLQKTIEAMRDA